MGGSLFLLAAIAGVVISLIVLLAVVVTPSKDAQRRKELTKRIADYSVNADKAESANTSMVTKLRISSANRTAELLAKRGLTEKLRGGLAAAGMTLKPEEFVLAAAGITVGAGAALFLISGMSIPAGVVGCMLGAVVLPLVLRLKSSRRHNQFLAEMPDMLTGIASGLNAGASIAQALDSTARDAAGVMGDELNRALIETRLGTSIPDALEQTAVRMRCGDLQLVVMAIRLQQMHGGNLAELLNTVSLTLRERVKMQRHVRALSAEGRMSLMVLMALPIVVLMFMAVTRPDYFAYFLTTGVGMAMLGGIAVMMLIGFLWARTIVKVEV